MKGLTTNQTSSPTGWLRMRVLKNEIPEDEKYHNLMSWLFLWRVGEKYYYIIIKYPPHLLLWVRCHKYLSGWGGVRAVRGSMPTHVCGARHPLGL